MFLYPVAFPQLMRDAYLIGSKGQVEQVDADKSNLYGLVIMFMGILSLIVTSIMIKLLNVSLRRLAILLPFFSSLSLGAQIAIWMVWHRKG